MWKFVSLEGSVLAIAAFAESGQGASREMHCLLEEKNKLYTHYRVYTALEPQLLSRLH